MLHIALRIARTVLLDKRMETARRAAAQPTPCMGAGGDATDRFYSALVNDLAIYGIGLAKRDRRLARLARRLEEYRTQPATYACTLVPGRSPDTPRVGCQP